MADFWNDGWKVDQLTRSGLFSNYWGGTGRDIAVDVSNLNESLSIGEIAGGRLQSRVDAMSLPNGVHSVSFQDVGAAFTGAEQSTLGGIRVNVNLTVSVTNGQAAITAGTWAQAVPDLYDFAPAWSPHRSFLAMLELR